MSIPFIDGFDFYSGQLGLGGRKWDQTSMGIVTTPGRFLGNCLKTSGSGDSFVHTWNGAHKTIPSTNQVIIGFAMRVDTLTAQFSVNHHPFLIFFHGTTAQASLWIDPTTSEITVQTQRGDTSGSMVAANTGFVPPFGLWFYLEVKLLSDGSAGAFEVRVNGQTKCSATSQITDYSGGNSINKIGIMSMGEFGPDILIDDLYIMDTAISSGSHDFIGEVRVQTMYADADGYQDDFLRSTGTVNASNVNTHPIDYSENGKYNYTGTVGAIDLYSIGNFTISGTIFAVQENLSFRKDDVGSRSIKPIMRTASVNYLGSSFPCYSEYTHAYKIWEINPNTGIAWTLTELNNAEFGITVDS